MNQQPDSPARNAGRHPEVRRHFHDELSELKAKLLTMSANAQEALDIAVDAALTGDDALAAQVIAGDRTLDALELEIEERVLDLLATQQPMARDLRLLLAAMKIANDLERVGDHAVNIAESAERLHRNRLLLAPEHELAEMARQARAMLSSGSATAITPHPSTAIPNSASARPVHRATASRQQRCTGCSRRS